MFLGDAASPRIFAFKSAYIAYKTYRKHLKTEKEDKQPSQGINSCIIFNIIEFQRVYFPVVLESADFSLRPVAYKFINYVLVHACMLSFLPTLSRTFSDPMEGMSIYAVSFIIYLSDAVSCCYLLIDI
jgi:hypothetical protein